MKDSKWCTGDWLFIAIVVLAFVAFAFNAQAKNSADSTTHTTASCTGTTGAALAANQGRVSALFVNDGTSVIYLKIGVVAVANEGIRLNANGGSYSVSKANENLNLGAVNCITVSATVVLTVTEWSN